MCECVPVGTNVGGIPNVIGDCGIIVDYGDVDGAVSAVIKATEMDGKCARERVLKLFPEKKREERVVSILHDL